MEEQAPFPCLQLYPRSVGELSSHSCPSSAGRSQTGKAQGDQHLHPESALPAAPTLQKAVKISQTPWKYLHSRSMPDTSKV